ncbi:MFS transporter [Thiomonas sp. X19]|uniref:MFS transporter n=1 Tax=Thiomonas sp. X19 TaxID=1050370 RepID=UPI000DD7C7C2|nr:MFS transporter [Thiomonas sp. X19]
MVSLLPEGTVPQARLLLLGRALRALVDGFVAVLLPAYLLALGFTTWQVGLLSTTTLLGSALLTLAVGAWGHRVDSRRLLLAAGLLMTTTGLAFAGLSAFWPLLLVAFVGTINPGSGDVSVFLPLEHARLAHAAQGEARTLLFARYSMAGALFAAIGALAAGVPAWLAAHVGLDPLLALRGMFVLYAVVGVGVWLLYLRLPKAHENPQPPAAPLGPSRRNVVKLAALFSIDAFAGGLVVNTLLALWLFQRFHLSPGAVGLFFFCAGLLATASLLAAPHVARRIGLLNTMVFTHIPSSMFLMLAALAPSPHLALGLLLARAALSQMDVPTRSAYVMAVVTPPERTAAASFTAVPRSLAAALGPTLAGAMLGAGWLALPLLACGALKIGYDLALLKTFRGLGGEL